MTIIRRRSKITPWQIFLCLAAIVGFPASIVTLVLWLGRPDVQTIQYSISETDTQEMNKMVCELVNQIDKVVYLDLFLEDYLPDPEPDDFDRYFGPGWTIPEPSSDYTHDSPDVEIHIRNKECTDLYYRAAFDISDLRKYAHTDVERYFIGDHPSVSIKGYFVLDHVDGYSSNWRSLRVREVEKPH